MNKEMKFCQSCGMPLTKNEDCGTNADGSTNYDYCQYCYKDGKFLQECTMDEMIEHCSQFVDEVNKQMLQLSIQKARQEFGAKRITLGVFDNNPSALHCYKSVGFKVNDSDFYLIDGEEWTEEEMEMQFLDK